VTQGLTFRLVRESAQAALYDSSVTVPGQTIGDKGPGCLGMVGLLVVAVAIVSVTAILIFVRFGPLFHAYSGGNTGTEICPLIHHVDGPPTQDCSNPIKLSP
jgi:hypothetical protein